VAEELPELGFGSRADLEQWLIENGSTSRGIWLRIGKKGAAQPGVSYLEAVEAGLCHGWIDGQAKAGNESFYLQRFTPRRTKSPWSRINRERAIRLLEAGLMQPGGLREVERAKADGRWDAAYEPSTTITVPEDLQAALDRNPAAAEAFSKLTRANRYSVLYRLGAAKRAETRARRMEQFVTMLAEGRTIYPQGRAETSGGRSESVSGS